MFSSQDLTLQALIDHCPLAIIALDREGKIRVWNPAAQRIFGWTASEVLGRTNPIIPAEAHGEYTEDLQRVFSGVSLKGKEVSRSHKDGRRVLVKLWTAPIQSEEGLITGTTAILEDVTQQKENERKLLAAEAQQENIQSLLQQDEERMRFAFDAATIGYWDWDIVRNTQVWSPIAYKLLGLPDSAPADFDILMSAVHPQDRQAFQGAIDVAIKCGEPFRLEYRNVWPDGSVHWRLAAGRVFCGTDTRPTRMTGIVVSIDELKQAQQNLELRAAALQAAANAIVITDRNARILWANKAFSELTGYSCADVVGQNPRILKSGKHDAAFYRELWQTISGGQIWRGELTNRRKDGSLYCEEMTITPVSSREGEPTHYIAIKQDISERHRSESALREAETKYRGMFENSVVGIYQCARDGKMLRVNQALARLHGYDSPEQLLATNQYVYSQLVRDGRRVTEELQKKYDENGVIRDVELEVYCKDGSRKWITVSSRVVRDDNGEIQMYEGVVADITERKSAEAQVQFLAFYDPLTKLPNRSLFLDRAKIALATCRRSAGKIALLFMDLDHFKDINDTLGHKVGDIVLKEVAERLKSCVRDEDTVARMSGDEFLILLNVPTGSAAAAVMAGRIRSSIGRGFVVQGHAVSLSCSIGISIFPDHATRIETLIKNADMAMYNAKQQGRNLVRIFDQSMNTKLIERMRLENELRWALDRQQMYLMYQPQVNAITGQVAGSEALLRWNHPELGVVAPDRFIPIAESTGLILPIGEWVLQTACKRAKQWQEQGLNLPVAVNVSGVQLRQEGFLQVVRSVLAQTELPPELLELELTESVLVSDGKDILGLLHNLEALGVRITIDDFGTGYSNLSYLKTFPIHKLKIDRSFVKDIAHDTGDAALTNAILGIAKILNIRSVAEAVETEGQLACLREYRCDLIQGYYFYKPLLAEEFLELAMAQEKAGIAIGNLPALAAGPHCGLPGLQNVPVNDGGDTSSEIQYEASENCPGDCFETASIGS